MMIQEFEKLTGIEPSTQEYGYIEAMYYEFDGDKKAFCKWFVENNGMVEALRRLAKSQDEALDKLSDELHGTEELLVKYTNENDHLAKELEKEQEWKEFEDEHNVKQADYEKLESNSSRKELSDSEAASLIAEEFGFDRSKIIIVHRVSKQEINRHNQVRNNGTYERKALFDAWDWNYIRFNVKGNVTRAYEMNDGELQLFWE